MKRQGRKPPKREPKRPTIDDDLIELALALDDNKAFDDVDGWLRLPWHDGWCAAELGWECWHQFHYKRPSESIDVGIYEGGVLRGLIDGSLRDSQAYEIAAQTLTTVTGVVKRGVNAARFIVAGLRCVQLCVSNSSGGGHVYNDVLKLAFEHVPNYWPAKLRGEVMAARCLDAIGVSPSLANDKNDRLRRAFTIAWNRGLYQAAYSLPRAL